MVDGRRIRLLFTDHDDILSPSQQSEELKRCWILLKPQFHNTIADLSAHILHSFGLEPACPHGLLLYMDDFLLPPFESTEILNERDIISVRKKGLTLSLEGNNATTGLDVLEMGNAQLVQNGTLILANEDFERESSSSEGEDTEGESNKLAPENQLESPKECGNATSNKRKAFDELPGSRKKKKRSDIVESTPTTSPKKNNKLGRLKKTHGSDDRKKAELGTGIVDVSPITKSGDQGQKNGNEGQEGSAGTKKTSSRSARRKRAKRQWIQEMKKIQKHAVASQSNGHDWKKPDKAGGKTKNNWKRPAKPDGKVDDGEPKGLLHWKSWSGKTNWDDKRNSEVAHQNGRVYGHTSLKNGLRDVVPAVTRPGHIRFEHSNKDHAVEQSQQSGERFQFNTSKRKGQKWGKDKPWFSNRKDEEDIAKARAEMLSVEKELRFNEPIIFDKLPPLCDLPKTGDVIGYRLIELSSTWTPELSPYQVGLVSWCTDSGKLLLMRFTECPTTPKKSTENDSDPQPNYSLYKADGPLEIDFKTLIDVRIVKDSAKGVGAAVNEDIGSPVVPASNDNRAEVSNSKNGRDLWEQFSEALSDKKTQFSQEDSWGKASSSNRSASSFRKAL